MDDLLFYLALILLGGSVIVSGVYYFLCWKNNKDFLLNLMRDRNYPLESVDVPVELIERFGRDSFNVLWFKISCRKKTAKEKDLNKNGNWMFFCGVFSLCLTLYCFYPLVNVVVSIFTAIVGTVLWIIFTNHLNITYSMKKAWKVYVAHADTEA